MPANSITPAQMKQWARVTPVAISLGLLPQTVKNAIKRGEIEPLPDGTGAEMVRIKDVKKWMAKPQKGPGHPRSWNVT